jgi:phage terminase large subunit-like protein
MIDLEHLSPLKDPADAARRMLDGEFLTDKDGRMYRWDGLGFIRDEEPGLARAVTAFDGLYSSPYGWD